MMRFKNYIDYIDVTHMHTKLMHQNLSLPAVLILLMFFCASDCNHSIRNFHWFNHLWLTAISSCQFSIDYIRLYYLYVSLSLLLSLFAIIKLRVSFSFALSTQNRFTIEFSNSTIFEHFPKSKWLERN